MTIVPVVFVHGIQGAWLKDEYPVDYDGATVWTGVLKKNYEAIHLHHLDDTVDGSVRRMIAPHQAVPIAYESLVDEIREEMDEMPYAYVFTYDWRKDNRLAAQALAQYIMRVLRIAGVHEKAAGRKPPGQVTLIGHSMGGLVIKYCALHLISPRRISKIITIATPYCGSLKAVEALLPGARNLFGSENQKSMRHASRTMPGVYQLLPTWDRAIVDENGASLDPFKVDTWQTALVNSLATRYGSDFFPAKLADARKFTQQIAGPWPDTWVNKVSYAYGTGSDTWWRVAVDTAKDNLFMFNDAEVDEQGDGTVHVRSSVQPEIPMSRTCRDTKNLVSDNIIGQHANMPNHHGIQDWLLGVLRLNAHAAGSFTSTT